MSNLSYCRFENTLEDLQDCYDALQEGAKNRVMEMSGFEREAMMKLINICGDIWENFGEDADEYAIDEALGENEDE